MSETSSRHFRVANPSGAQRGSGPAPYETFIVGCGDIGLRVARLYRERAWPVAALARSEERTARLQTEGLTVYRGDLDRPDTLRSLPMRDAVVFYFAPPPGHGDEDPRMAAFVAALELAPPARVVYLSTSGVYGDRAGAWVDEATMPDPQTDRARRRLHAERSVRDWGRERGVPVVVLRVGGIYGPGRLPVERLRRGSPVLEPSACGYTNRIHADDLATICIAAAERGQPDGIYNVSDGQPGSMTEYFWAVADRLGLPRPPAVSWEDAQRRMTPAMLSYLTESRRLDSRRMCEELGVTLRYPTLADGLATVDPAAELARV